MARYDPIVQRPTNGGRRAAGALPDGLQRALYQQMLDDEIGPAQHGFVPAEPERSWRSLIVPVMAMLLLAAIVLGGLWLTQQVRSGRISFASGEPRENGAEQAWRAADRAKPAEEGPPLESEMEKMLEEQRRPPAEEVEEEAQPAE